MAATDEFVHRVRADKTGAARNHVTHSRSPPSSCGRVTAGNPTRGRLLPAVVMNASSPKTPGPRFDTLIVRGERSRTISARGNSIVRRKRAGKGFFQGGITQKE